jgi:transposase-like protein
MDRHYGEIVEYVVRKAGFNISELAKSTSVDRRTLYNWFKQKHLKQSAIFQIGCVIKHDFGREFPELFTAGEFDSVIELSRQNQRPSSAIHMGKDCQWKLKYLALLEEFNRALLKGAVTDTSNILLSHKNGDPAYNSRF